MPKFSAIYYSNGDPKSELLSICAKQLSKAVTEQDGEIITVTWHGAPEPLPSTLIWQEHTRSHQNMYNQILAGIDLATSDVIFLAEHDVLYAAKTFEEMTPFVTEGALLYNRNVIHLSKFGYFDPPNPNFLYLSSLCGTRKEVSQAIKDWMQKPIITSEPVTERTYGLRSSIANVDIRHNENFTAGWQLLVKDGYTHYTPGWGHYLSWISVKEKRKVHHLRYRRLHR